MQQRARRPSNRAAPAMDPTTIPAICPPVSPPLAGAAPVAVLEAEGPLEEVELGNSGGMDEKVGSCTPTQRLVTFEPIQQESVAFGELEAQ